MTVTRHQHVECSCGRVIYTCRCPGPKQVVVQPHPACGHVEPLLREPLRDVPGVQVTYVDPA